MRLEPMPEPMRASLTHCSGGGGARPSRWVLTAGVCDTGGCGQVRLVAVYLRLFHVTMKRRVQMVLTEQRHERLCRSSLT